MYVGVYLHFIGLKNTSIMKGLHKVILISISILLSTNVFSQEPLIDFQYWDTFSFQDDGFTANQTYLEDINNHGVMVGWFVNEAGNVEAFVFYENFKMLRYNYPGFTHTEFLGINDEGIIIGAAYDGTTNRTPIYIKLVDSSMTTPMYNTDVLHKNVLQSPAIEMMYGAAGATNRYPQKISNYENYVVGTISTTPISNRWFHYRSYDAEMGGGVVHYTTPPPSFTAYPTYGSSMSNDGKWVCGFCIEDANYIPYIYDMEGEEFDLSNSGLPSVNKLKFKDINNSGYVTYTYRNTSGVWVAGLAKREEGMLGGYNFTQYADFPFKNTSIGSSCNAINDSNDIVGYYSVSSERTVAFFAVTHEWKIPDFDFYEDKFSFLNVADDLDYACSHWQDPFMRFKHGIMDSPLISLDYANIISRWDTKERDQLKLIMGVSTSTLEELLALVPSHSTAFEHMSPNFISFVANRNESNTYISNKIKLNELYKFTDNANIKFDGFCYGMILAAISNNADYNLLKNKFMEYFTITAHPNAIDYALDIDLVSILGTLQFSQFNIYEYENFYTKYKEITLSGDINKAKKEIEIIARNMMGKESCRLFQKMAFESSSSSSEVYNHATLPYKVIRKLTSDFSKTDTFFAYDPNFEHPVKYIIAHDLPLGFSELIPSSDGTTYTVMPLFLGAAGPSIEDISFYNSEGLGADFYEKTSTGYRFHIATPADIRIENTASGQFFQKEGEELNYDMPVTLNTKFSGLDEVYSINTNSSFPAKTTITQPIDGYSFDMEYIDGRMFVSRNETSTSQTDIIYHNVDYQKIENPDEESKEYTMATIYNPSADEESFVEISEFELAQNDTVSLINVDQYHFHLLNGNDEERSYKLRVRFLSEDDFFHVSYADIQIDSDTRHIILLQPTDETNKVIILVDRNMDGSIDDTLHIVPSNIYEVDNWNANISIFPNPSSESFNVKIEGVTQEKDIQYEIFALNGKIVSSGSKRLSIGMNEWKIDMQRQPIGMYYLVIRTGREIVNTQKLIKH